MISLQLSKEEKQKMTSEAQVCGEGDEGHLYPYGTSLHLEGDIVGKLGLDGIQPGSEVTVLARAIVERVDVRMDKTTKASEVHIQLTDMEVSTGNKNAAATMYGKE